MLHPDSALLNTLPRINRKVMKLSMEKFAKEAPMGESKVDGSILKELLPLLTKVKDNMAGLIVSVAELDPQDQFARITRDLVPFKSILSQTLPLLKKANFKGYPLEDIDALQQLSDTFKTQSQQLDDDVAYFSNFAPVNVQNKVGNELKLVQGEFEQIKNMLEAKLSQFNASGSAPSPLIGAGFNGLGAHQGYEQYALPRRYL